MIEKKIIEILMVTIVSFGDARDEWMEDDEAIYGVTSFTWCVIDCIFLGDHLFFCLEMF